MYIDPSVAVAIKMVIIIIILGIIEGICISLYNRLWRYKKERSEGYYGKDYEKYSDTNAKKILSKEEVDELNRILNKK